MWSSRSALECLLYGQRSFDLLLGYTIMREKKRAPGPRKTRKNQNASEASRTFTRKSFKRQKNTNNSDCGELSAHCGPSSSAFYRMKFFTSTAPAVVVIVRFRHVYDGVRPHPWVTPQTTSSSGTRSSSAKRDPTWSGPWRGTYREKKMK